MSGAFITFEGADGSGKSTQIKLLAEYVTKKKYPLICTREPGGTAIGDKIRALLLDSQNAEMHSRTELLLYAAARAQHVEQVILPALRQNKVVLCDRFNDSTLVYQGMGRQLSIAQLQELNKLSTGGLEPHLTILLDIPPTKVAERLNTRLGQADRMEQAGFEFYAKVCAGYRILAQSCPQRIYTVSALGDIKKIHEQIVDVVESFIAGRCRPL